jgi:hypothetical protein
VANATGGGGGGGGGASTTLPPLVPPPASPTPGSRGRSASGRPVNLFEVARTMPQLHYPPGKGPKVPPTFLTTS